MENNNNHFSDFTFRQHIQRLTSYSRFLGIMCFIFAGIVALVGIFAIVGMSFFQTTEMGGLGVFMGLIYLGLALLYYFPGKYLMKTSSRIKHALATESTEDLLESFPWISRFFRFIGILTIIFLVLYIVIIIAAISGAALGANLLDF